MTKRERVEARRKARRQLADMGWPLADAKGWRTALVDFKRGFAFTKKQSGIRRLPVNRLLTKGTIRALNFSTAQGGKCSPHFRYVEFRCKGTSRGLTKPEDNWIRIHRAAVRLAEQYRDIAGPFVPVSGCRSDAYNALIGGASASQHRYNFFGRVTYGFDVPGKLPLSTVENAQIASGIGVGSVTGTVQHIDIGHRNPLAKRWSTKANPTVWFYAGR